MSTGPGTQHLEARHLRDGVGAANGWATSVRMARLQVGSCRLPRPVRCASLTPDRVPGKQPEAPGDIYFSGDTANSVPESQGGGPRD